MKKLGIWIVSPRLISLIEKLSGSFGSISNIQAITLFPFVVVKTSDQPLWLIRHEETHIRQIMVLNFLVSAVMALLALITQQYWFLLGIVIANLPYLGPFYIWYGVEYLTRLAMYKNGIRAYDMIAFERHAYLAEDHSMLNKHPLFFLYWLVLYFKD
jgi:hypothetical protein